MSLLLYKKKKQLGNPVSIRSAVQQNRIGTTVLFWASLLIEKPSLEQSHADETVLKKCNVPAVFAYWHNSFR